MDAIRVNMSQRLWRRAQPWLWYRRGGRQEQGHMGLPSSSNGTGNEFGKALRRSSFWGRHPWKRPSGHSNLTATVCCRDRTTPCPDLPRSPVRRPIGPAHMDVSASPDNFRPFGSGVSSSGPHCPEDRSLSWTGSRSVHQPGLNVSTPALGPPVGLGNPIPQALDPLVDLGERHKPIAFPRPLWGAKDPSATFCTSGDHVRQEISQRQRLGQRSRAFKPRSRMCSGSMSFDAGGCNR